MSMMYSGVVPAHQRPARIGFLLSQLGTHAAELFAEQVKALGITPSEAGVIRIIARTPDVTQRELANQLGATQSRVVALVDDLERKGLATRTRSTTDRRVQHLALTDQGRALMPRLRTAAEAQEASITNGLSEREVEELYMLLSALSTARGLSPEIHTGYRNAPPESASEAQSGVPGPDSQV
jgi:DNA-binding MarR family transcriptional regulator